MFAHIENKKILWEVLQKSPFFIEFWHSSREAWFQDSFARFYRENPLQPRSKTELLEANKAVLQYMIEDLKRILGYKRETLSIDMALQSTSLQSTYNVEEEKKAKEEREKNAYASYQAQYHTMLQTPKPDLLQITEHSDDKIKNMDELLQQQIREREMDMAEFSKSHKQPERKIRILDTVEDVSSISQEIATIIEHSAIVPKSVNWQEDSSCVVLDN